MPEYVTKDNMKSRIDSTYPDNELYKTLMLWIDKLPTEDVAPVVHAYWMDNGANYKCSNCGNTEPYYDMLYCPHCGARMDEEEE